MDDILSSVVSLYICGFVRFFSKMHLKRIVTQKKRTKLKSWTGNKFVYTLTYLLVLCLHCYSCNNALLLWPLIGLNSTFVYRLVLILILVQFNTSHKFKSEKKFFHLVYIFHTQIFFLLISKEEIPSFIYFDFYFKIMIQRDECLLYRE